MNTTRFPLVKLALAATGLLFASQAALACTTDNWNGGVNGMLNAAQPDDPTNPAARYSGLCGLEVVGAQTAYVQDNSPGGIDRIIARFYVLAGNDSQAIVYRGRDGSGGTLFEISIAAGGTVTATSGAGNASAAGVAGNWNSIEIDWSSGSGMTLTVNGGMPVTAGSSTTGLVSNVRLGNLNSANGTLTFDAYESRRSTAIGRLLRGDANNSGTVNIVDASAIIAELDGTLQTGQPDCNENGVVNIVDASCVITLL